MLESSEQIWEKLRPELEYRHPVMRDYYRLETAQFQDIQTLRGYLERTAEKFRDWWKQGDYTFVAAGGREIPLPGKPYMAVRLRRVP